MLNGVVRGAKDMASAEGVGSLVVVVAALVALTWAGYGVTRLAAALPAFPSSQGS